MITNYGILPENQIHFEDALASMGFLYHKDETVKDIITYAIQHQEVYQLISLGMYFGSNRAVETLTKKP